MKFYKLALLLLIFCSLVFGLVSCASTKKSAEVSVNDKPDFGDQSKVDLLIAYGRDNCQVMDHLKYLTQEIGPRLTGSTRLVQANEWAREQFEYWGLANAHLAQWGSIPVGFNREKSYGKMLEPEVREFEFTWNSWSAGTVDALRGNVLREPLTEAEYLLIEDQLPGAWILRSLRERDLQAEGESSPEDFTERMFSAGIAGLITASKNDLVHTRGQSGWRDLKYDEMSDDTTVVIRRSDYDAINSRLTDGEKVVVEFDLNCEFIRGPVPCYNTIAEIKGSVYPDEVVILSGHLDSWDGPGSQGCCDNGTGASVVMEAARLLSYVDAHPKRTIRFVLWTGEEQGLLGSQGYVDSLSDKEKAGISAVFVEDGGTNYEGGVSGIASMVPMLAAALAPMNLAFPDMPVTVKTVDEMPTRGYSDHAPFNKEYIPGFYWAEVGTADYGFIWHTQNDRYDQAMPEYLIQSAICSAVTAYNLADAQTMLPREVEQVD